MSGEESKDQNIQKTIKNKLIARKKLENPYDNMTYHERLVKSGAIDLRDNCIIEDLGNGYSRVIPIDETKLVK